jgi:dCMP deaminase
MKSYMTDRPDWDPYWLSTAYGVASRATCLRKKVGAIIVKDNRLLTAGYNGSLSGQPHCTEAGCEMENGHCIRTVHAEVNAIADAARRGVSVEGGTMYSTITPCRPCRMVAISAGIVDFKWSEDYP